MYLDGVCQVDARHCSFENNTAIDITRWGNEGFGGAIFSKGTAVLTLEDVMIRHNFAGYRGGGIATINAYMVFLSRVHITNNNASDGGGGVSFESPEFDARAVQRVVYNNTARYAKEILVPFRSLALLNDTKQLRLVSRLGTSEGALVLAVNATGLQGLPAAVKLQTTLQGTPITTFDTGDDGIGVVSMTVRQPPGDYVLAILPTSGGSGSSAVVTVLECPIGDVAANTGDACITCVSGSYSFNPKNITCDACPANAGMHLLFYFFIFVFCFGFFTKESKKYVLKKKVKIYLLQKN